MVDCGPPETSNVTEVEPVGGPTTFGSSFTYSCITGYNFVSGDVVRTCTETGMYNGTLIECEGKIGKLIWKLKSNWQVEVKPN